VDEGEEASGAQSGSTASRKKRDPSSQRDCLVGPYRYAEPASYVRRRRSRAQTGPSLWPRVQALLRRSAKACTQTDSPLHPSYRNCSRPPLLFAL